jgi:hypothetical protein
MKNIIVISHRRSGTHLTIDSIRNNFLDYKMNDYQVLNENSIKDFNVFLKLLNNKIQVIKTHFLPDFNLYSNNDQVISELDKLFKNSYLIYIYRNGLDVMVSLYEYMKKYDIDVQKMSFNDFLVTENNFDNTTEKMNRMKFWNYHIQNWKNSSFNDKILWIKYEDFITNYQETINNISNFFTLKVKNDITDIRISENNSKNIFVKIKNYLKGIKKTGVSVRKGQIGDYKNYFNNDSLELFKNECDTIMKNLKYFD